MGLLSKSWIGFCLGLVSKRKPGSAAGCEGGGGGGGNGGGGDGSRLRFLVERKRTELQNSVVEVVRPKATKVVVVEVVGGGGGGDFS